MAGKFVVKVEEPEPDQVVTLRQTDLGVTVSVNGESVIRFASGKDFIDRYNVTKKTGLRNASDGYVAFSRERN